MSNGQVNAWQRPLADSLAAVERARAAGDTAAVQEIEQAIRFHPSKAPGAYQKAIAAGDNQATAEIRSLYGKQKPIKTKEELASDPLWVMDARRLMEEEQPGSTQDMDDYTVGEKAIDRIRFYRNNSIGLGTELAKLGGRSAEGSQAFVSLQEQYEKRMPVTLGGVGTAIVHGVLDPTNLIGFGVGGRIASAGARQAGKAAIRETAEAGAKKVAGEVGEYGFDGVTREAAERAAREGIERGVAREGAEMAARTSPSGVDEAARMGMAAMLRAGKGGDTLSDEFVDEAAGALVSAGVKPVTKRDILKGSAATAGYGAGAGGAWEAADQTIERDAGLRESYDPAPILGGAAAGAVFGGGIGALGGSVAYGKSAWKIGDARKAIQKYQQQGDVPTTVSMQLKAIDQLPVPKETKAQAHEMFEAGDVGGLGDLFKRTLANKEYAKIASSKEFNAGVVRAVNTDAMNRGSAFLSALRDGQKKGVISQDDYGRLKSSFDNAKAPNAAWSPIDIDTFIRSTSDPIMRDAARGLKDAAYRANETVGQRTIRAQMNGLEEMAYNPINKALADGYVPGGSTAVGFGTQILSKVPGVNRMLGGPKPVEMMVNRAKARRYAEKAGIGSVFNKADIEAGVRLRKIERSLGKLERDISATNLRNTAPKYRRQADAQEGVNNGLQTFGAYLGMENPQQLKKTLASFVQAHPDREDIRWFAEELMSKGGIRDRDAFYGLQDDMARWLVDTKQKTPQQLADARQKVEQVRLDKEATQRILEHQALVRKKIELGEPLTRNERRTQVILEARALTKSLKMEAVKAPGIRKENRSRLIRGIKEIAEAKNQAAKGKVWTRLFDSVGDDMVAAEFVVNKVSRLVNYGPME